MAVFKRSPRLRTKVIVLIILIVAAVLSASTYLSIRMSEELLERELKEDAITLAWEMAAGIRSRADLQDAPTLERKIEGIIALRPLIELIDIFDLNSKGLTLVASSSGMERSPETLKSVPQEMVATLVHERGNRLWDVVTPIRLGNEAAGALRMKISLKKVDELAARTRLQFSLIMGVAVVLIVAVLGAFFHPMVDRPIRELIQTMGRAEAGDLSARAGVRAGAEIGDLGGSLNRMLNRIEEAYHQNVDLLQQINRFNEELKEKVWLATQELEWRNEELRRANELLFNTQLKLSRSERLAMVGQLAATVSHEIGTPLTSISGHIQLALQEPALDASTKSRLKIVEDQIARTVEVLQGILKLSRPPEPSLEPLDVNGPLQEIIDLTSPGLGLKNVVVTTRLGRELPPVLGDAHQLQQVFLNLIVNALDSMPDGGDLTVETDPVEPYVAQKSSRWVRVQIADTGYGVATDDQKRIFEPFFTTKDVGSGTGLGLAVCQKIIKAHGGTIELESQVGRGTTFTILLPAQET